MFQDTVDGDGDGGVQTTVDKSEASGPAWTVQFDNNPSFMEVKTPQQASFRETMFSESQRKPLRR